MDNNFIQSDPGMNYYMEGSNEQKSFDNKSIYNETFQGKSYDKHQASVRVPAI